MSSVDDFPFTVDPTDARHRATHWRVVEEPVDYPVSADAAAQHLRLSSDQANAENLDLYIAAATDYAEEAMQTSLVARVLEATYYDHRHPILLPRGPLIDVSSVADADGTAITDYTITHIGRSTRIVLPCRRLGWPITVTYRAGYPSYDAIPASIRLAILCLVGTYYEARESTSEGTRAVVPHQLEAFFRLHGRHVGIG